MRVIKQVGKPGNDPRLLINIFRKNQMTKKAVRINGRKAAEAEQEKLMEGKIEFYASDFRSKSGGMQGDKISGTFSVHSNLLYRYEVR